MEASSGPDRAQADVGTSPRTFPPRIVPLVFVVGALCQYLGAAIGVFLFDTTSPAAVAWLRAAGAAVVLLAWRRPWRTRWTVRTVAVAGAFGVVTVGMNLAFYEAIARIPLGTAVAIEFLGPVLVAAVGSRRPRDVLALLLVIVGVSLVAGARVDVGLAGVGFALLAAALWAGYVVLGKFVADAGDGLDSLAVGMAAASVVLAPLALAPQLVVDASVLLAPSTWLLGLGVGVMSSVIPYALDQVVLRSVGRARFALLLALLPTTATVVGLIVLAQVPSGAELAGIGCVVAAVALGGIDRRAVPGKDEYVSDVLLHMCTAEEWESAMAAGVVAPPSLQEQGFVHLSTPQQVHLPANRLFRGRRDIVVLFVDPSRLDARLEWEPGVPADPDSMQFPHAYGPIPLTAIVDIRPYLPGDDGVFVAAE